MRHAPAPFRYSRQGNHMLGTTNRLGCHPVCEGWQPNRHAPDGPSAIRRPAGPPHQLVVQVVVCASLYTYPYASVAAEAGRPCEASCGSAADICGNVGTDATIAVAKCHPVVHHTDGWVYSGRESPIVCSRLSLHLMDYVLWTRETTSAITSLILRLELQGGGDELPR